MVFIYLSTIKQTYLLMDLETFNQFSELEKARGLQTSTMKQFQNI